MEFTKARMQFGRTYLTRKDWRNRIWPAGCNVRKHKIFASRKVRRTKGIFNGGAFKKLYSRYLINDF